MLELAAIVNDAVMATIVQKVCDVKSVTCPANGDSLPTPTINDSYIPDIKAIVSVLSSTLADVELSDDA
jgi:hypothetical protein